MGNQRHHTEGHAGRFARTWTRDKARLPSWALHRLRLPLGCFTEGDPPKVCGSQCQRWIAQCPRGARWPASHTFGASGARRCGWYGVVWGGMGGMGWYGVVWGGIPRLPPPPELRGRAACAPGRSARCRLSSVTAEPCVCPPRMRRCPSGRRPVERGGRDERLDGQGRVRCR